MKVSVLMTTYEQEAFVAQAINSVLAQDVSFDYEIVVGEDGSTDRTREIVLELQRKFPDKIRVFSRESADAARDRMLGIGGKTNFIKTLAACRGEYVALLDGDDYWTSPSKLQKQVEFLDRHRECSSCFHDVQMFHEDRRTGSSSICPAGLKRFSTLEDLIELNVIPPCSVMFRRGLFGEIPLWFRQIKSGDWALNILNAQFGAAGYIEEVMAAYRVHESGFWSSLSPIQVAQANICLYENVDEHLKFRHHKQITRRLAKCYLDLSLAYDNAGELGRARKCIVRSILLSPFKRDVSSRMLLKIVTRLCAPTVYRGLKAVLDG